MNSKIYSEVNTTLFTKLPLNIVNNVCNMLKRPKAKYKRGQAIKLRKGGVGFIDEKPYWNDNKSQWHYTYSYGLGGTSEGSIIESSVILKR